MRSSGGDYPALNTATSRMSLDGKVLPPREKSMLSQDVTLDVLREHSRRNDNSSEGSSRKARVTGTGRIHWRRMLAVLAVVQVRVPAFIFYSISRTHHDHPRASQGFVVPPASLVVAFAFRRYALSLPGVASLCLLAFVVYRERGPGGALEYCFDTCAPVGCLRVEASSEAREASRKASSSSSGRLG